MKLLDVEQCVIQEVLAGRAGWRLDNSALVCSIVIPNLDLSAYDKRVMRWAYGQDGSHKTYEIESDGETLVKDKFAGGAIKSPGGVTHDYINRVGFHTTPDRRHWSPWTSNALYHRILIAQGLRPIRAHIRWLGVTLSARHWWRDC